MGRADPPADPPVRGDTSPGAPLPDARPRKSITGDNTTLVQAIVDDVTINPDDTRREVKRIRARAHADVLADPAAREWTTDDGYAIKIIHGYFAPAYSYTRPDGTPVDVADRFVVEVAEATKDGAPLTLDLPLVYVNPPLLVARDPEVIDGVEHDVFEEDVTAALQEMVADTIRATGKPAPPAR